MESGSTRSDKDLVKKLKSGQVGAFDLLYERYSRNLYSFSRSLLKTHEDSEEVVQEVFLRVWKKRMDLIEQKSFKSFLFSLAYNVIIDQFRKRTKDQKYEQYVIHMAQHNNIDPAKELEYEELKEIIANAIDELPKKRKRVYQMSRLEGLNYKEIARRNHISTKTVENHINLALKHIRHRLGGMDSNIILFLLLTIIQRQVH
ncbi:MAG: RNA polymerase sigma-70 factor [Bacteroidota bacterium]